MPPNKDDRNRNYKVESKKAGRSGFQRMVGMNLSKARKKRMRRMLEDEEETESNSRLQGHLPSQRSLVVDCSLLQFKCTTLYCVVGPMQTAHIRAVINIPMELFPVAAENILKEKDIMILYSSGGVAIEDISNSIQPDIHEPDFVEVSTTFFGKFQEFRIDIWIFLISMSGGIMILFPMILFLFKVGFFKRRKRKDMELLKENSLQIKEKVVESFELNMLSYTSEGENAGK
ncbi:integrin alpha-IIb-like isoform X2 [Hetaerina americana]